MCCQACTHLACGCMFMCMTCGCKHLHMMNSPFFCFLVFAAGSRECGGLSPMKLPPHSRKTYLHAYALSPSKGSSTPFISFLVPFLVCGTPGQNLTPTDHHFCMPFLVSGMLTHQSLSSCHVLLFCFFMVLYLNLICRRLVRPVASRLQPRQA